MRAEHIVDQSPGPELTAQGDNVIGIDAEVGAVKTELAEAQPQGFWQSIIAWRVRLVQYRLHRAESRLAKAKILESDLRRSLMNEKCRELAHNQLTTERQRVWQLFLALEKDVNVESYLEFLETQLPFNVPQ